MTGRLGRPYIAQLTRDMKEASAELEFEKAARLRDQIQMLKPWCNRTPSSSTRMWTRTCSASPATSSKLRARFFYVRAGSIRGERNWSVERVEDIDDADLMADLLVQVYSDAPGIITPSRPRPSPPIASHRLHANHHGHGRCGTRQATRERNTRQETTGARTCWHPSHRYRAKSSCPSNRPAVRNSKAG